MRRDFPRKVKAQAILRAGGCCEAVCLVRCAHCAKSFDRGYRISSARAARPQYCSPECRAAEYGLRAKHEVASRFWGYPEFRVESRSRLYSPHMWKFAVQRLHIIRSLGVPTV